MGLSFKKLKEGLIAQVNPFDGNMTFDTVTRNKPVGYRQPPASQDVIQKIQNARYGVLANNPQRQTQFLNSVRPTSVTPFADAVRSGVKAYTDVYAAPTRVFNPKTNINEYNNTDSLKIKQLQQAARSGQISPQVASANINALMTTRNAGINQIENTDAYNPTKTNNLGGALINTSANRKLAPITSGMYRSAIGTGEAVSGLYDTLTPGKGNNRIGQNIRRQGEIVDQSVKQNDYNQLAYKAGQIGTDIATFMLPGGVVAKGATNAGKLVAKAPVIGKVASKIDKAADAGNLVAKGTRYLAKPTNLVNTLTDTALNTGYRANRGQDINAGTLGMDAGLSIGMSSGIGLAGAGAKAGLNKVVKPFLKSAQKNSPGAALDIEKNLLQDYKAAELRAKDPKTKAILAKQVIAQQEKIKKMKSKIDQGGYVRNPLVNEDGTPRIGKGAPIEKTPTRAQAMNKVAAAASEAPLTKKPNDLITGGVDEALETIDRQNKLMLAKMGESVEPPKPKVTVKKTVETPPTTEKPNVAQSNEPVKPKVTTKIPETTLNQAAKATQPYVYASNKKGVSMFNRAWQTVAGVIDQYGDIGKEITRRLHAQRDAAELTKQAFYSKIPTVMGLKGNDMRFFAQSLEDLSNGRALDPSTPQHIRQAITEWNAAIPDIRNAGIKAGLDIGDLGENYFPRMYKDLDSQKGKDRLIKTIMDDAAAKGKPMTNTEASMIVDKIRENSVRTYGNLEKTRQFDVPGYEMTHDAIIDYTNRALDRITKAEQFGPNNEYLAKAFQDLKNQGYSPDHIDDVFERYVNIALGNIDHNTKGHKISSGIRKFNAVTSLSAAGISNMTQSTNTATVGGIGRTIKAIVNQVGRGAWGKEARAAAERSGIALDHSIADITQQQLGTNGVIARNIASPFFHKVEKFNRQVSAMVGADYGDHLAAKGDINTLRNKFGVTGEIGDRLTDAQKIQMARKMVEISQFKVDPMDLPGWADSALGKLALQFRSFGYKQTEFMWNQVLREATKGNFAPLARFIAVGAPAGLASTELRSLVQMKDFAQPDQPEDTSPKSLQIAGRVGTGLAAVGGFGLAGTAYTAANRAARSRTPTAIAASTIGGPTAGLIVETSQNIDKASKGDWQPLVRQGVRKIPAVGPTLANVLMPYDSSKAPAKAGATVKPNATPAELDKQAKADLEKLKTDAKAEGYSIEQLVNGKYAYTINGEVKTADTLKKANAAVAKAAFGESDQNIKVIGDMVYRKNAQGDISTMSKTKYDYSIGTQELEKYKRAGDLDAWNKTANKQLDSIEKQLADPNIDPLDKIQLENDAEALMSLMAKYAGYGGFTKGKSGSGGGSGGNNAGYDNPYKYVVSGAYDKPTRSNVKLTGASAKRGVAMKAPTKPKVSIKKSLT